MHACVCGQYGVGGKQAGFYIASELSIVSGRDDANVLELTLSEVTGVKRAPRARCALALRRFVLLSFVSWRPVRSQGRLLTLRHAG